MNKYLLNDKEKNLLFRTRDITPKDYRNLIKNLQARFDIRTSEIEVSSADIEKIIRFIRDYKNNGLQMRLAGIFNRHFESLKQDKNRKFLATA